MPKLIIEKEAAVGDCVLIRVNKKANALIEDVAKRSGRSKQCVTSKMIEFAYDYVICEGEEEQDDE